MPKLSEESRELLREVSAHPTLFASAPEEADGLIKGLSWMILVKELDLPVADAGQTVWRLVKEVTQSIDA